jgi:hypothetical protein
MSPSETAGAGDGTLNQSSPTLGPPSTSLDSCPFCRSTLPMTVGTPRQSLDPLSQCIRCGALTRVADPARESAVGPVVANRAAMPSTDASPSRHVRFVSPNLSLELPMTTMGDVLIALGIADPTLL